MTKVCPAGLSEKLVIAAATLYDARRVLRGLFGDQYDSRAESWREAIRLLQAGRSVLDTLIEFLNFKDPKLTGGEAIWLLAAAIDLMEEGGDACPIQSPSAGPRVITHGGGCAGGGSGGVGGE